MEELSLQFQGASSFQLQVLLLAGISFALGGYGVWLLVCGRVRSGLVSLAAAVGGIAPALLIDGVVRHGEDKRRGWRASSTARLAALAGTVAIIALAVLARGQVRLILAAVLTFQIVVAVAVFYAAVYSHLGPRRMTILMALRCGAILALVLILFKPAFSFMTQPGQLKPILPILVDRSASMSTTDRPDSPDRYRYVLQRLLAQRGRIEKHFDPAWSHFAGDFQAADSLDELHELSGDGDSTDISAAILRAVADYPRQELAGVLLLSDGIHNASGVVSEAVIEAGVPIYVAGIGSADKTQAGRRNIEIISVDAPMEAAENNVATITARVKMTGFSGESAQLRLMEEGIDQPVDVFTLRTSRNSHTIAAKLKWTPKDAAGRGNPRKLRIEVAVKKNESTDEDNSAELHVLVTQPRIRLLYVAGSIRPEYKWLKRRLAKDPNVQFMALIRISANRFSVAGSIDGKQLNDLPTSDEDFKLLDVLVLGDLDATFLSRRRMRRIRRFVNDGGALLMLGGRNSFGPGGYTNTDIEAILPVLTGGRTQKQETANFLPRLTAAGKTHAIFDGITDFFPLPDRDTGLTNLPALPKLLGCVAVRRAKTSATVLAIHPTRRNEHGPLVILAVQRFGAGRTAAFTADTTYRWQSVRDIKSPYEQFWGQFIRWLANAETQSRQKSASLVFRTNRSYVREDKPVELLARVTGSDGKPARNANVSFVASYHKNATKETHPMTQTTREGLFEATWKPDRPGKFILMVTATDETGKKLATDTLPLTVAKHSAEMDRLARNDELLRKIADKSEGAYQNITQLPELIDKIVRHQRAFVTPAKSHIVRLYYIFGDNSGFTALFLIFVALMTAEWLLRRNWQLH